MEENTQVRYEIENEKRRKEICRHLCYKFYQTRDEQGVSLCPSNANLIVIRGKEWLQRSAVTLSPACITTKNRVLVDAILRIFTI